MPPKTTRQGMLAGESYNCLDSGLDAERQQVKALLRRCNRADGIPERQSILEELLGQLGHGSTIEPPFHCTDGCNTSIGDHSYLDYYSCIIPDKNEAHIMTVPAVPICTAAHPVEAAARIQGWEAKIE